MFDRSIPMIGFHTRIEKHEGVEPLIKLIEEGLVPALVNTLVLEVYGAYRCFPEYSSGTVTYEDLGAVADVCEKHGVRLVPLVQCLTHQSQHKWDHPLPLYKAHPEFLECPEKADAGIGWPEIYQHCWCPSNDGIYEYMFPIIDEVAEACRAQAVHIGMDEWFDSCMCPRCKGKEPAKLYAHTVKMLHDHLSSKGLDTMLWGDRLLPAQEMGYSMWEADRFNIHPAIDMPELTNDLIICDWHYDIHSGGYPSIEYFMKRGFFTVPSVFVDAKSAQHFFLHAEEGVYMKQHYGWPGSVGGILYTHWAPLEPEHVDAILSGIRGEACDNRSAEVGRVISALTPKVRNMLEWYPRAKRAED